MRNQKLLKLVLSIFIFVQVLTVVICPNPESLIFRKAADTFVVYGNLFGLNTTWRFFSPTPAVRLIDYEVFKRGEDKSFIGESAFHYPNSAKEEGFREIYNRKVNNGMYVVAREMVPKTLGPYLCRKHQGAEVIALYLKGRVFPTIERSQLQGDHVSEIGQIQRDFLMDVHCEANE